MGWLKDRKSPAMFIAMGLVIGLLIGCGMMVGAIVAMSRQPQMPFPERPVYATASHGASKLAIATGRVSDDSEGLFTLDFLTGDITCRVIYPRTRQFGATFVANAVRDLAANPTAVRGKDPSYLMVTGQTSFNIPRVGQCVLYVADANTGNYVAYGMPWNRNADRTGQVQTGQLIVIGRGTARNIRLPN